jgi:hypothetical protein
LRFSIRIGYARRHKSVNRDKFSHFRRSGMQRDRLTMACTL